MAKKKPGKVATMPLSKERLRVLVEKATVDAYGDDEQRVGFFTMLEDSLAVPILDLPLPSPRPKGWEWIEAYRHWANPP